MRTKGPGRAMNVGNALVIARLKAEEIYSPASITYFAKLNGMLQATTEAAMRMEMQRMRVTLGRFSNNHAFPDQGDGMVKLPGQGLVPGWCGWRWKEAMRKKLGPSK